MAYGGLISGNRMRRYCGGRCAVNEEAKTPEEIAQGIVENIPYGHPEIIDEDVLVAAIAQAIRDAYERAAKVAEGIGWQEHVKAHDPQEDNSEDAGDLIAAAIRALKGENT